MYPFFASGQEKISFKDSIDRKLDVSDWVLTYNGFIPVLMPITEPALGYIGGALAAVFIDENTPYRDTVDGKVVLTRVKPNIYGVAGLYTANGTWLVGGAAMGVIKKWKLNYRIGTGYADVNLDFYKEIPELGEQSFEFNIRTYPLQVQLIKQIKRSPWFVGLNYLFLKTELKRINTEFHSPEDVSGIISRLGMLVEFDERDNIFTPNKGFRWNAFIASSDDFLGSDYEYQHLNSAVFYYLPIITELISGFRLEYQQIWGDAPFYMLPYLNMRGIPTARYQGNQTLLAETEWRWDFTDRYSLVAFAGAGKALAADDSFSDQSWHGAGGGGFRYLIARKLKLRMGLDVAQGPEDWGYYIVFGTNWVR